MRLSVSLTFVLLLSLPAWAQDAKPPEKSGSVFMPESWTLYDAGNKMRVLVTEHKRLSDGKRGDVIAKGLVHEIDLKNFRITSNELSESFTEYHTNFVNWNSQVLVFYILHTLVWWNGDEKSFRIESFTFDHAATKLVFEVTETKSVGEGKIENVGKIKTYSLDFNQANITSEGITRRIDPTEPALIYGTVYVLYTFAAATVNSAYANRSFSTLAQRELP